MQRLDIARHDQRDPPLDALGTQPDVDQVLALAADHDRDVARVEKGFDPLQPRSRCRAWLAAGCDSPIRIAARLTLASLSRASSATSKLRSSEFKFMR